MKPAATKSRPVHRVARTTPWSNLPEWLRVDEAASWLDTSTSVVYGMAQSGRLRSVRLGRLVRVHRDGLRFPNAPPVADEAAE